MSATPLIIERVTRVAPLGLRFWDAVSGKLIGDWLRVIAYHRADPGRPVQAALNRSGVYVFQSLPGLSDLERGAGDPAYWAGLPFHVPYVVEVVDNRRRFLPFRLAANLPVQGLLPWECEPESPSPLSPATMVPLYSSPSRPVPAGMAVVRAQLWDWWADQPAAWAVLKATLPGGQSRYGLADDQGRIALIFPYPEPSQLDVVTSPLGSPPGGGQAWSEQSWPIQFTAFYTPSHPVPDVPDLCMALSQAPATLWSSLSPAIPLTQDILEFGRELVLKSESQSVLYTSAADSPPN